MRLLTLCFPTFGRDNGLHLTSDGKEVVLAPDEHHVYLKKLGWEIDVVSIAPPTDKRLFCSKLPILTLDDVRGRTYDVCWHMFRDPTQPEVLNLLASLPPLPPAGLTLNDALRLRHHAKPHYLPILHRHGLAPEIMPQGRADCDWELSSGSWISPDRGAIDTNAFNNNRGDYPDRGHGRIVTRYIDNSVDGLHSFVRFGYALGTGFRGNRYWSEKPAFRSGEAAIWEEYVVPEEFKGRIHAAMLAIGVDICHVEAIPHDNQLYIVDVNPFPSANGRTLSCITQSLCDALHVLLMQTVSNS